LTKLKSNDKITLGDYKKQLASLEKERKTSMQSLLTNEQKNKIAVGKKMLKTIDKLEVLLC
jgi:hypothetical protein